MKKITYIILAGILLTFPSCKDADSIYKEYVVPNGKYYPAKAMDAEAHPGNKRIRIAWINGTDPKVEKARIFWNNGTDSTEVNINAGMDTIRQIIEPLDEDTYSFMIRTYDDKGNVSIPVEVMGTVYGEAYQRMLNNRILESTYYDGLDLTLNWYEAGENEEGVNVNYTDIHGVSRSMVVDPSETETIVPDFDADLPLFYSTMYKPDSLAIDVFHAETVERMIDLVSFVPKNTWAEYTLPGDAAPINSTFQVRNIWDNSFAHSGGEYHSNFFPLPQMITWDLGVKVKLSRMILYPRHHGDDIWVRGHPKVFEIYGSLAPNPDGSLDDSWTLLGRFECIKPSPGTTITEDDIAYSNAGIGFEFVKNELADPSATVRYIRFRTVSNYDTNVTSTLVVIQEISFWGRFVR